MLIYYYLSKDNSQGALNIIKKRKIPLQFVQSLFPLVANVNVNVNASVSSNNNVVNPNNNITKNSK